MSIVFEFEVQVDRPLDVQAEAERFAMGQVLGTRYQIRDLHIGVVHQVEWGSRWTADVTAICDLLPERGTEP